MMVVDNIYNIGDTVYLKTDIDQLSRLVTGLTIRTGCTMFELSCGEKASMHYDFEISKEKKFSSYVDDANT